MKIGINGMGRIGRAALKLIMDTPGLELVGVNDIVSSDITSYLLKYDSVYGRYNKELTFNDSSITIGDERFAYSMERDPSLLPWKKLGVEVVIESTGVFTKEEQAKQHIVAGAKTVIISAPSKSAETPTIVHGVNTSDGETAIFSCAQ